MDVMSHRTLIPARTLSVAAALLSLAVMAGCGGGSGDSDGGAAPKGYTSAKQIGEALKCTATLADFKQSGATNSILCQYAEDNVIVSWFASADLAEAFQHQPGTVSGPKVHVYGSNWAVGCFITSACESAQTVLGGKLGS